MLLKEVLDVMKIGDNELDVRLTYTNEFDEECNRSLTFVSSKKFKEGKEYWSSHVVKYDCVMPVEMLDRYNDFKVSILNAEGKDHFFIFAHNFEKGDK